MHIPKVVRLAFLKTTEVVRLGRVLGQSFSESANLDMVYLPSLGVVIVQREGVQDIVPIASILSMQPVSPVAIGKEELPKTVAVPPRGRPRHKSVDVA